MRLIGLVTAVRKCKLLLLFLFLPKSTDTHIHTLLRTTKNKNKKTNTTTTTKIQIQIDESRWTIMINQRIACNCFDEENNKKKKIYLFICLDTVQSNKEMQLKNTHTHTHKLCYEEITVIEPNSTTRNLRLRASNRIRRFYFLLFNFLLQLCGCYFFFESISISVFTSFHFLFKYPITV